MLVGYQPGPRPRSFCAVLAHWRETQVISLDRRLPHRHRLLLSARSHNESLVPPRLSILPLTFRSRRRAAPIVWQCAVHEKNRHHGNTRRIGSKGNRKGNTPADSCVSTDAQLNASTIDLDSLNGTDRRAFLHVPPPKGDVARVSV